MVQNLNLTEKGKLYQGRVISVGECSIYQDKFLHPVLLRHPEDSNPENKQTTCDLFASEVTVTKESNLAQYKGQVVNYVVISPGQGTKERPAWVKLDAPMKPSIELRERLYIANNAYRIAADLVIDGGDKTAVHELAKIVAKSIVELAKEI